ATSPSLPLRPTRVHGVGEADIRRVVRHSLPARQGCKMLGGIPLARFSILKRLLRFPLPPDRVRRLRLRGSPPSLCPQHPPALRGGRRGEGEEAEKDEEDAGGDHYVCPKTAFSLWASLRMASVAGPSSSTPSSICCSLCTMWPFRKST